MLLPPSSRLTNEEKPKTKKMVYDNSNKDEYPPAMPSYSRPWGTHKYTTTGGRLIIQQDPFDFIQGMQAKRSNGRLTLSLVTTIRHALYDHNNSGECFDDNEEVEKAATEAVEEDKCCDDEVVEDGDEAAAIEEDEDKLANKLASFWIIRKGSGIEKGESTTSSSSSYSFCDMSAASDISI